MPVACNPALAARADLTSEERQMFFSFFPRPKLFFWSALVWTLVVILVWFLGGRALGVEFRLGPGDASQVIGVSVFWSKPFVWLGLGDPSTPKKPQLHEFRVAHFDLHLRS